MVIKVIIINTIIMIIIMIIVVITIIMIMDMIIMIIITQPKQSRAVCFPGGLGTHYAICTHFSPME